MIKVFVRISIFLAMIFLSLCVQAQTIDSVQNSEENENEVFTIADEKARPSKDWQESIRSNLHYPSEAKTKNIEGRVMVCFIVEKDGSITHVKAMNDPGGSLAEEAVRVVKILPNFEPAMENGKPVRFSFCIPINFILTKGEQNADKKN